jgi:hypothetical protein
MSNTVRYTKGWQARVYGTGTKYCIYRIVATVVTSGNDSIRSHYSTVCYATTFRGILI